MKKEKRKALETKIHVAFKKVIQNSECKITAKSEKKIKKFIKKIVKNTDEKIKTFNIK